MLVFRRSYKCIRLHYIGRKNKFILKSLRTFRTRIRNASHVDETRNCARTSAQTFSLNFHFRDVYIDVTTYSLRTRRVRKMYLYLRRSLKIEIKNTCYRSVEEEVCKREREREGEKENKKREKRRKQDKRETRKY